jgi:hypothetical protein
MPTATPKASTPPPSPRLDQRDNQGHQSEARLFAVVEAAYILGAIRR